MSDMCINMQSYWSGLEKTDIDRASCTTASPQPIGDYTLRGTLKPTQPPNSIVKYWAANPIDRRDSFVGSGLPFPSPEIAYENTPNVGSVRAANGTYVIKLYFPNCFYTDLGRTLLPPHVLLKVCGDASDIEAVVVGPLPKHRLLTNGPGDYTRSSFKEKSWNLKDLERFST